ncbi:MAG: hypothetical protein FWC36_04445 [Spirochaetes bacterium]|nr:hypothetical protein [Spirochaetota bacterium]
MACSAYAQVCCRPKALRLAVAGNPVSHSKSPAVFYKLFDLIGLEGFYSRIAADSFEEAIGAARMAGITGLNITSPFKQDAAAINLGCPQSEARPACVVEKLMAANTVVFEGANTCAGAGAKVFNTDYLGVYESVKNLFPSQEKKIAFVIGAGGAGIAAACGLSIAGFGVTVFNRTISKAAEKTKWIKNCSVIALEDINKHLNSADIIVNALPVNDIFFDISRVEKNTVIFDANYKNSALTRIAAESGLQVISGLKWLVNQAIAAFEIFTGLKIPSDYINLFKEENIIFNAEFDKKNNIALIGFMGSGKTVVAEKLARFLAVDFIDTDKEIEKKEQMTIADIFENKGENYFRQTEKRITENIFNNEKGKVIACGGGIVIESENRKLIAAKSFPVWLITPPEVSVQRITDNAAGGARPLLNKENKYEEAGKLFNERIDLYGITSSLIIDSSKRSAQETARKLYEEVSLVFKK